jgi:hypothetical protein
MGCDDGLYIVDLLADYAMELTHTAFKDFPIKEVEEVGEGVYLVSNALKPGYTIYNVNGVAGRSNMKIDSDDTECLKLEKLPNYDYTTFPLILSMCKKSISIIDVQHKQVHRIREAGTGSFKFFAVKERKTYDMDPIIIYFSRHFISETGKSTSTVDLIEIDNALMRTLKFFYKAE